MKKLLTIMVTAMLSTSSFAQLRSGISLNDLDTSVRPADD